MKKIIAIFSVFALALSLSVSTALAEGHRGSRGSDDSVRNSNSAFVGNCVEANANTGMNGAGGSEAGDGGNGGGIVNNGDDVEGSSTGNGGAGGNSGEGGTVITGNANANAGVVNVVGSNDTRINRCTECEGGRGDTRVMNRNGAIVLNGIGANANTGLNEADGSEAGDGGNAGGINNQEGGDDVEDSSTGTGGRGGNSGAGGFVTSGHANSNAGAINVVGRNITRVRR